MKRFANECSEAEQDRIIATFAEIFPRVLPADWICFDANYFNSRWLRSTDGLKVCCEVEFNDSDLWLHVSFSRQDRDPSYFDMKRVKDMFVGPSRKAIMVLPSKEEHYNFHKHCLHFWAPIDRDPLPDFRTASGEL